MACGPSKAASPGSVPSYDDGEGDPVILAEYRSLEAKLSFRERSELLHVADDNHPPRALPVLRAALDKVAGRDTTPVALYVAASDT
jgi:hypothetical protein